MRREDESRAVDLLTPQAEQMCADLLAGLSPNGYGALFTAPPLSGLYTALIQTTSTEARSAALEQWLTLMGHPVSARRALLQRIANRTPGAHQEVERPRLTTRTLVELLAMRFPPPVWAVPDLIPQGLTLFAGKPKMGKSHLMLQCGMGIAWGGYVFGTMPVQAGTVLYLDMENGDELLQERVIDALHDQPCPPDFHYATAAPRIDDTLLESLDTWMEEHPETRLIVIDTFEAVRGVARINASVYREDYAALRPLADWAKHHHVAVVVLHHISKSLADDVFATISGSFGLTGAVDNLMVLSETPSGMVLAVKGRRVKHRELALSFDQATAQWSYTGDAEEVAISKERKAIITLLRGEGTAFYPREIAEEVGKRNVRVLLGRMVDAGELTREKGKYALAAAYRARMAWTPVTDVTDVTIGPATRENGGHEAVTPPRYTPPTGSLPTRDPSERGSEGGFAAARARNGPIVTSSAPDRYSVPPEENEPIVTSVTSVTPYQRDGYDAWLAEGDPGEY